MKFDDIKDEILTVSRYYKATADDIADQHTKAGHGPRPIGMTSLALSMVEAARKYKNEHGMKDEYIFQVAGEKSMKEFYDRLRKSMDSICKQADIPKITPYSGRRTFISSLIDTGVNLKTVQKYVGHLDSRTTLNCYNFDQSSVSKRRELLEKARPQQISGF